MDQDSTKVVPLVERVGSPASDGGANRGETMCSGAANYASVLMGDDGTIPDKHIIFASTAGHGGYSIDQLEKGTEWYNFFIKHVTEAKRLNAGKDYKVQVVCWVQGENDAVASKQTTYALDVLTYAYVNRSVAAKMTADPNLTLEEATE
ncbi:hypothetical protein AIIMSE5_004 [Acinetobacter phage AIIMS-AbE5-RC]|uniref:Sialate O-acetylesterase domain-containing protein n=1 Tax=Acinetobacter phage AIIMS-AbE5-RC TaxID=2981552 RepID=A0A9X9JQ84_9CAUD|nr:hypothetical protein AIIMSE5_004 [Acinetobacter phage AIIMS-AbE5-RC]